MIKRWDLIIVAILILISFLPIALFSAVQAKTATNPAASRVAVITQDNKVIKKIQLTENKRTYQFVIHSGDGDEDTVEVQKSRIRVKSATCPDQVCVLTGFIDQPGETIVCLPYHLVIEIQSDNEPPQDIIVSS
jgi:hypothetical protein